MILAVAPLSPGWQAFLFGAAFIAFTAAFVISAAAKAWNLIALGLALFTFVFFFNALAAA